MSEIDKFREACNLLKGIEVVEGEEEGRVTRSFLRRAFEMLEEAKGKEEYLISVGYMVARRKGDDNLTFYKRLRELVERIGGDWNNSKEVLKGVFECIIKLYHIRLKLGEDLCTKP